MNKFYSSLVLCVLFVGSSLTLFSQNYNLELQSTVEYPGETLANIAGYWKDGREYALVGASRGLSIVEITDPANPVTIVQIPGPDNLWKEIKTFGDFAYVTSEGGQGCQIVDLSDLPSPNLNFQHYDGAPNIPQTINTIHALHIDTTAGFMYLFGGDHNGTTIHDLNTDPYNPVYVGEYQSGGYIHDGYADSDTLYACHIYDGLMTIVDMTDKAQPQVLGSVMTPNSFTHNAWLLPGRNQILTTDERDDSYLACYDISDPTDIVELDRFQCTPGSSSVVHNTHLTTHYAVTSWYADGVNIVDAWRPQNLVQVGWYDTWAGTGGGFDGCWGAYPMFPSGTIIASNINPAELFILKPTYIEACYVEGVVTNGCDGSDLSGAEITINSTDLLTATTSDNDGIFRTGQPTAGDFQVTISKTGFVSQTFDVTLDHHVVIELTAQLEPLATNEIDLNIASPINALAMTDVVLQNQNGVASTYTTDADGNLMLDCIEPGNYTVGVWGYRTTETYNVDGVLNANAVLQPGYYDDFTVQFDWTTMSTAQTGDWVYGDPISTAGQLGQANSGNDSPDDQNVFCYMTGNGGGGAGDDDVDGGVVTLISPAMDLTGVMNAAVAFDYWFYNAGGQGNPNDALTVYADNGSERVRIYQTSNSLSAWRKAAAIPLADYLTVTDNMKIEFETSDLPNSGHLVEAAIDLFEITNATSGTYSVLEGVSFEIINNPTLSDFTVRYNVPAEGVLRVRNNLGQLAQEINISSDFGTETFGASLSAGIYYLSFETEDGRSEAIRLIKN